jgi:hypothetical protein
MEIGGGKAIKLEISDTDIYDQAFDQKEVTDQ